MTDELIERLEKATGPDRELDIAICAALGKTRLDPGFQTAPAYTDSLDAALTLVPEGLGWIISRHDNGGAYWAEVGDEPWQYTGATPAIALCIPALKARSAQSS